MPKLRLRKNVASYIEWEIYSFMDKGFVIYITNDKITVA